jgi:hypothetical protein
MTKAGVLIGLGGLKPSADGKRIRTRSGKRMVFDGPFTESKELIAGYAILKVASMDEALRWLARFPDTGEDEDIEIRPMYDEGPCGSGYRNERNPQPRSKDRASPPRPLRLGSRRLYLQRHQ